jgi:hypothetical protein
MRGIEPPTYRLVSEEIAPPRAMPALSQVDVAADPPRTQFVVLNGLEDQIQVQFRFRVHIHQPIAPVFDCPPGFTELATYSGRGAIAANLGR